MVTAVLLSTLVGAQSDGAPRTGDSSLSSMVRKTAGAPIARDTAGMGATLGMDMASPARYSSVGMIESMLKDPMLKGLVGLHPSTAPFLPVSLPQFGPVRQARPSQVVRLQTGDTLSLDASIVTRTIAGHSFTMYGFNDEYPGPLLHVSAGRYHCCSLPQPPVLTVDA